MSWTRHTLTYDARTFRDRMNTILGPRPFGFHPSAAPMDRDVKPAKPDRDDATSRRSYRCRWYGLRACDERPALYLCPSWVPGMASDAPPETHR